MKYMTVGLKKEVSLVLLPIDDFTNRIITGSLLRVYIKDDNRPSIRKSDGYHIFCDIPGSQAEVCLEGPLYQKQILQFPIERGKATVHQVRMLPGREYPIPKDAAILSGILPKNSMIRVFGSEKKKGYKLLNDYDPAVHQDTLSLFQINTLSLLGRRLCISEGDQGFEFCRMIDQRENNCILEKPLLKAYTKKDTVVYPTYEAYPGEDGSFYLPIGNIGEKENYICALIKEGEIEKTCRFPLKSGAENRITEEVWKED